MASYNPQILVDKIALMTFEITELIRIQALRTDLTADEKTELSQDEYDLDEKIYQYLKTLLRMREICESKNLPYHPDMSVAEMAGEERMQANALRERLRGERVEAGTRENPIVIE